MLSPKYTRGRFVRLTSEKKPLHSLKKYFTYDEVKNDENIGLLVDPSYVVIDVDDSTESELLSKWVKNKNVKCNIMKTSRGKHFWFHSDEKIPNHIHVQNALAITCDVRCGFKLCFVVVKKDGKWRDWECDDFELSELDDIPKEVVPIKDKLLNAQTPIKNCLTEGSGRRDALFNRIIPLANNGFTKVEIRQLFEEINRWFFESPLSMNELDNMFTDEDIFSLKVRFFTENGKFQHHIFAYYLHEMLHGTYTEGCYYVYRDGIYVADERLLFMEMNTLIPSLTDTRRKETYKYLVTIPSTPMRRPESKVALQNGVFDFETQQLLDYSPQYFITSKIDVKYDPTITYNEYVEKFLNDASVSDENIRKVLEEMIGYCFVDSTFMEKAFVIKGYGSNGKSTFLNAIRSLFGSSNISSIGMEELSERFKRVALVGKKINLCAELPESRVTDLHIFKQLVTGDEITVEHKHQEPFKFVNTAKLIFSANEIPKMADVTEGFIRRFMIIPFACHFKDDNRIPDFIKHLTTPEAKSYWLNLAIEGYKRLRTNNRFTYCEAIERETVEWGKFQNSARRWISSLSETSSSLENFVRNKTLDEVYRVYQNYCISNNQGKTLGIWKVKEELLFHLKEYEVVNGKFVKGGLT